MKDKKLTRIGMIAAGSGIAPMYQLAQTVSDLKNDNTSLSLIYANRTPVSVTTQLKSFVLTFVFYIVRHGFR